MRACSDHCPLILDTNPDRCGPMSFRFGKKKKVVRHPCFKMSLSICGKWNCARVGLGKDLDLWTD